MKTLAIILMMGGQGAPSGGSNIVSTMLLFFIIIPLLVFPWIGFFTVLSKYKRLKRSLDK